MFEIASGTGEHAVHFARGLPDLVWQPTDADAESLRSIAAWGAYAALVNLCPPLALDVRQPEWPAHRVDALLCINLLHISPWAATEALMAGAGRLLQPGAPLVIYGPFHQPGRPIVPSNAAFDESLRGRDPEWGLRDVTAVAAEAFGHGLALHDIIAMPANNLTLIFRRC